MLNPVSSLTLNKLSVEDLIFINKCTVFVREGQFIQQNIEKWKTYQYEPTTDPDEMAVRFTELVNDLGYAKTFYPQSKVTLYLNKLASGIYLGIYKNKKEDSSRIIRFWKTELPVVIKKYHRELLLFFSHFFVFCPDGRIFICERSNICQRCFGKWLC